MPSDILPGGYGLACRCFIRIDKGDNGNLSIHVRQNPRCKSHPEECVFIKKIKDLGLDPESVFKK